VLKRDAFLNLHVADQPADQPSDHPEYHPADLADRADRQTILQTNRARPAGYAGPPFLARFACEDKIMAASLTK